MAKITAKKRRQAAELAAERAEYAAAELARGCTAREVRQRLRLKYGRIPRRSADKILAAGRLSLIEATGLSKQELLGEAVNYYKSILKAAGVDVRDKLTARARLDKILALEPQYGQAEATPPPVEITIIQGET